MNQPRRRRSGRNRSPRGRPPKPVDIWRTPGPLPPVEPITIPEEVGALLRSLGDPPAIGGNVVTGHYFSAIVERAAAVAAALAVSAGVLAESSDDTA